VSSARCYFCCQENCSALRPPCRCDCHAASDPVATLRAVIADAAARFDGRPIERASFEARVELTQRCDHGHHIAQCPWCEPQRKLERTLTERDETLTAEIARLRRALGMIAQAETYAKHANPRAQVSRVVRIARAALNGDDVE